MKAPFRGLCASVLYFLLAACDSGGAASSTHAGTTDGGATQGGTAGTDLDTQAGAAGIANGGSAGMDSSSAGAGVDSVAGAAGTVPEVIVPRPPAVGVHGQLHVDGTALVDEAGNAVQLKGPSSMWLNWETSGYAQSPEGVKFFRDNWQASLIRAAMGVDATGAYLVNPDKAKSQVRAIVDLAIQLGIYVIIDWHDHAAETHQAEAIAFFTEMATEYGAYPNVLYETYNEPQKVDWNTVVKPYHEAVVAAIRAVDPDNVIILGTPNWSQYVDVAAANPVVGTNLMYTLHFYSCSHGQSLRNRGTAAYNLGLPIFVTEWGATNADGGKTGTLCLDEAQNWHNWMNERKISWAAWKLDDCTDLSCYFVPGTPITGNWTDEQLNGHAPFVRDRMRE
jgi:endoglucanase